MRRTSPRSKTPTQRPLGSSLHIARSILGCTVMHRGRSNVWRYPLAQGRNPRIETRQSVIDSRRDQSDQPPWRAIARKTSSRTEAGQDGWKATASDAGGIVARLPPSRSRSRVVRGDQAGRPLEEQGSLAGVARERGGALELRARLAEAAELDQQIGAHAGQQVVTGQRRLLG